MATIATLTMIYVAIGAVLFAHPRSPAVPNDFDWRAQVSVFRDSLPAVLAWPLALWLWCSDRG
jgi:ribose/xylose/arabinose/galactoside ABC-type transport system permease subunit